MNHIPEKTRTFEVLLAAVRFIEFKIKQYAEKGRIPEPRPDFVDNVKFDHFMDAMEVVVQAALAFTIGRRAMKEAEKMSPSELDRFKAHAEHEMGVKVGNA